MKLNPFLTAVFTAALVNGQCNNNCARRVAGTKTSPLPVAARSSLCSTLLNPIVYATPTVTTTPGIVYQRRAITGTVPSYATGECSDITQYWNACQCFGITPSTVTLPAGATVAAAAPTCTRGLEWAIYPGTEGGWGTGPLSIAALVGGKTPFRTGRTTTFGGFGASGGAAVSPYDMGGNPYFGVEYTIVAHRGYLAPQFEGWYEFVIDTADDFLGFWLGDAAVDGFSTANLVKRWDFPTYQSYYIVVTADMVGKYIPIRLLWANNGGPGSLQGRLLAHPQGVLVLGSAPGSTPNLHIISSCSGTDIAPAWKPWQNETPA